MIGVSNRNSSKFIEIYLRFGINLVRDASTEECRKVGPDSYVLHESRSSVPDMAPCRWTSLE